MQATFEDAFNFLCHDVLGQGIHRKVFSCRFRDDLVVKVEDNGDNPMRSFANVREMDFWTYWRDHEPVAKWLAPCEYLSPDGRLMLQRRVDPIPSDFPLPEKLQRSSPITRNRTSASTKVGSYAWIMRRLSTGRTSNRARPFGRSIGCRTTLA